MQHLTLHGLLDLRPMAKCAVMDRHTTTYNYSDVMSYLLWFTKVLMGYGNLCSTKPLQKPYRPVYQVTC